ncbi:serine hydrolase [Sphingosinicella rhizophila]|uniref:Serine hydrolase n=1 Tax=Sphingosinicella rhizophila TaxID=3050082 RepID=A0ABU3Q2A1_9SPHN|nr:serine hydrolase [Sphingosinicella sp. GR2756]MDT9597392.1 serine hydrolase [Sphingosinicella sp. GR2756]
MRKLATLLIFTATATAPVLAQSLPGPQAALDAVVAPLAKRDAPGCAAAVAENGNRIATSAFGMADLEHGIANRPDSVFEAGSVSKQFTAAAILLLAADGKLALTDDVRKYLPELPDYGRPITINHLLSHTSGLRDWGAIMSIAGWERSTRAYTNDDALRVVARQKALNYRPGDEYSYTNSGYNLMAVIVERVSGESLAEFSKKRMFAPLGMSHTQWRDDFRRIVKDHAVAYNPAGEGWEEARPFENVYGNGGLLTTVGDLLIWNEALGADRLGPGITARLQEQAALNDGRKIAYARGLSVGRYNGHVTISHSGATGGYRAWLERYPAEGLSVAILCNGGSFNPVAIGRAFVDTRFPKTAASTAEAKALAPDDPHGGLFYNRTTGKTMKLVVAEGRLKPEGGPVLDMVGEGRFRAGETELAFTTGDSFDLIAPDGRSTFVRTAHFAPDAATLAAYAGRYSSDEAEAAYDVAVDGEGLRLTLVSRPKLSVVTKPAYRDAFIEGDTLLRFRRDASGKVNGMSFGVSRVRDLAFLRVSE